MDDDGHAGILDDRRPGQGHPRLEPVGVVDVGKVDALEGIVDGSAAFQGGGEARAADRLLLELELADLTEATRCSPTISTGADRR